MATKSLYYNWANRIFVNWDLLNLTIGERTNCKFTYHNTKTGKESTKDGFTFSRAILLAESRREDGRYRNYEFYID